MWQQPNYTFGSSRIHFIHLEKRQQHGWSCTDTFGSYDRFVQANCHLGAENYDITELSELTVFPNPASTEVFLNGIANGAEVEIFNSLGQIAKTFNYEQGQSVKLTDIAQGLYILRAKDKLVRLMVK